MRYQAAMPAPQACGCRLGVPLEPFLEQGLPPPAKPPEPLQRGPGVGQVGPEAVRGLAVALAVVPHAGERDLDRPSPGAHLWGGGVQVVVPVPNGVHLVVLRQAAQLLPLFVLLRVVAKPPVARDDRQHFPGIRTPVESLQRCPVAPHLHFHDVDVILLDGLAEALGAEVREDLHGDVPAVPAQELVVLDGQDPPLVACAALEPVLDVAEQCPRSLAAAEEQQVQHRVDHAGNEDLGEVGQRQRPR
mmetsp:Transcript_109208/g.341562  ORF Transcript_109208/g.341562 Transcript_109208/m.341562 type:complete len:246 (+) Transcript_109208:56-793(+)